MVPVWNGSAGAAILRRAIFSAALAWVLWDHGTVADSEYWWVNRGYETWEDCQRARLETMATMKRRGRNVEGLTLNVRPGTTMEQVCLPDGTDPRLPKY